MVLVLGAGLAGLSAAHHLGGRDVLVLERDAEVGGLCRSRRERGFTFDLTGHLLHLRRPEIRAWAEDLLPGGWQQLERSAWVASHGVLTPYPFQVNTAGLPLEVRLECLLGFVETLRAPLPTPAAPASNGGLPHLQIAPEVPGEPSFGDWIVRTFGPGFARHFFEPYNRKLWQRDLSALTSDWVSWSIPRPELADVLRGALVTSEKEYGYNPRFLYPRAGGIDHLPRAIAARLAPGTVRTGCAAESLNAGARRVRTADGESHEAEAVLSSLPLPALAALTEDLPDALRRAARELSWVSLRVIDLGVKGEPAHPGVQWVYVPDAAAPFHRVGFPAALTPAMAPAGHHSINAEISLPAKGGKPDVEATLSALVALGLLRRAEDVVHTSVVDVPCAYVVFDRVRRRVLPELFRWYVERRVIPLGRYGAWDYLSMEDSLLHGRQVAEWVEAHA